MNILAISALIVSWAAFAHEGLDWREDMMAYLSVEEEAPIVIPYKGSMKSFRKVNNDRVDMASFEDALAVFSGKKKLQMPDGSFYRIQERGSQDELTIARSFLAEEYKKLGFTTELHRFGTGTNFIAEKKGTETPEKVLILSSHIDSVGNAGANDDGTGTIGVLTIARELAKNNYAATIRILGFDREEKGMKGSSAYVATIVDKKSIIGDIHFEMIGHHSKNDGRFHLIDCNRKESLFLSSSIRKSVSDLALPLRNVYTCTDRSDHASFWEEDIPAVVFSENFFGGDPDPCYHEDCDVMDGRLNLRYMQNILSAVLDTTEKLAKKRP